MVQHANKKVSSRRKKSPVASTLLPHRVASSITIAARGSTAVVNISTYFLGTALDSSRAATLTYITVLRRALESIIDNAAQDIPESSGVVNRVLETLSKVMVVSQLSAATSFYTIRSLLDGGSIVARDSIKLVDAIFGSTESSRVLCSIQTLLKRELGNGVGIYALTSAILCMSILQSQYLQKTASNQEEMELWDVVVLETGEVVSQNVPCNDADLSQTLHSLFEGTHSKFKSGASYIVDAQYSIAHDVKVQVIGDSIFPLDLNLPANAEIISHSKAGNISEIVYRNVETSQQVARGTILGKRSRRYIDRLHKISGNQRIKSSAVNFLSDKFGEGNCMRKSEGSPSSTASKSRDDELNCSNRSSGDSSSYLVPSSTIQGIPGVEEDISRQLYHIAKYVKFSSASYGRSFHRLTDVGRRERRPNDAFHRSELYAFANHVNFPVESILLCSYEDSEGLSDEEKPLCLYVAVDHESECIVLTIRGTLGMEDVLTDLLCDYEDVEWQGLHSKAHSGMLRRARLILRRDGRPMSVIAAGMNQWQGYGLVVCGHSLGGGVGALLTLLTSEKTEGSHFQTISKYGLPEGRWVHCYTYGTPATVLPQLGRASKNLVTSVIYGLDLVPCLSLGHLRDMQAVAQLFEQQSNGVLLEIKRRFLSQLTSTTVPFTHEDHDSYLWQVLVDLRQYKTNEKLVPPGEVIHISEVGVLRNVEGRMKLANRIIGKVVLNVEKRFSEPIFGRTAFHHSPLYYERSISVLAKSGRA